MAIIDGKAPPAEAPRTNARVVVKLVPRPAAPEGMHPNRDPALLGRLQAVAPGVVFKPYFADDAQLRAATLAPFNRYVAAEFADRTAATALVRNLASLPEVEDVYVEGGPVPPPIDPSDDPRSANQGYLDAAPGGIDARWAWSLTSGAGISFVDLERGWTLNHEDLAAANITLISGLNQDFTGHGTSVLGEVVAVDNKTGDVGIAPDANARVVSQWRTSSNYNTAAAILSAEQAMSAGDVLLLEAQTTYFGTNNLPVEVETATFDAIRHAVDAGIVVVEAAGNGSQDLDAFVDFKNRHVLDRASADFKDSGAIVVGAASSTVPHTRLGFSNFGSRIDCYGWGENIDTTGDGWQGNTTTAYTGSFGGTSGASPIVAGAAVLIQSRRKSTQGAPYEPSTLRYLMSTALNNTASGDPATDRIGVMPNLRGIIEAEIAKEKYRIGSVYAEMVYILFGIINDAPGLIWVPGKGPQPGDPGWGGFRVRPMSAEKRDLVAALAVTEIADKMTDPESRAALVDAAVQAMHRAADRIAARG